MSEEAEAECLDCLELEGTCPACSKKIHEAWHAEGHWWILVEHCHPECPGLAEHPLPLPATAEIIRNDRFSKTIRVAKPRPIT